MTGNRTLRRAILLSVAAAVVTIGMKATAFAVTGSAGLLSDALESGVNLLAAGVAYFALWYAARPADDTHTYGHDKVEFFASGFEGALILTAGFGAVALAVWRLIDPQPVERLGLGTAIAGVAALINLTVAGILLRLNRSAKSAVVEADAHHLLTDVYTTAGVIVGLLLVWLTGLQTLDPLLALAVGLNILWTGFRLVRTAVNGLMDRALPPAEQDALRVAILSALPAGTAFHALRTRRAGQRTFAEFHFLVGGDTTVREAHDLAHQVEATLVEQFPGLTATIHVEPIEDRKSWEEADLVYLGGPTGPGESP